MSGGKAKRANSATKKVTVTEEINHAAAQVLPTGQDYERWISTLEPLTLLKAASKHAAKLISRH